MKNIDIIYWPLTISKIIHRYFKHNAISNDVSKTVLCLQKCVALSIHSTYIHTILPHGVIFFKFIFCFCFTSLLSTLSIIGRTSQLYALRYNFRTLLHTYAICPPISLFNALKFLFLIFFYITLIDLSSIARL